MKIIHFSLKIIIINLLLFIDIFIYVILNNFFFKFYKLNISDIINQNKSINLIKLKGLKYLKKCLNNSLKNQIVFPFIIFPKISIIIPVHNCHLSIELAVRSIQYQNFDYFEIILVNDYSNDNSSTIIKKLQNNDKRIKILTNKKNMGILYSRCIGVLNSKGNYIFVLDNDDTFSNKNILKTIYLKAKKNNYDIVEFKSFDIPNYNPNIKDLKDNYFNHHQNNLKLYQPQLGLFPISKNNKLYSNDYHLWGKCILSKLYKNAVNLLGIKRYSIYNCWTEDISIIFIIFNLAKSYIFLNIYGIFHLNSKNTTTFNLYKEHILFSEIYLLDILIDFLKDNKESKIYAVYKALKINNQILYSNKKLKIYFKSVLKKILDCKYINKQNKFKILNKFKLLFNSKII